MCLGERAGAEGMGSIFRPVSMRGEGVVQDTEFKYLGTIINNNLNFQANPDNIYKKARQRLHLHRQLKSFNASKQSLAMVNRSLIESVLYHLLAWELLCDSTRTS